MAFESFDSEHVHSKQWTWHPKPIDGTSQRSEHATRPRQFVKSGCVCNDGIRYIPVVRFVGLYDPVDNANGYPNKNKAREDNLLANLQGNGTWSIVEATSTGPGWRDLQSRGYFDRPIPGGTYRENLPPNIFKKITGSHAATGGNPCYKEINKLKITDAADREAAIDADQWIRNAAIKAGVPVRAKSRRAYGFRPAEPWYYSIPFQYAAPRDNNSGFGGIW